MSSLPVFISLPIELTNGNYDRKKEWWTPAKQRKQYERDIRLMFGQRQPFAVPVEVDVIRVLGKGQKFWDSSSILRGNYKEIEDSMVACGWFRDDSYKWIRHTRGFQDAQKREQGPMVEIRIREAA